MERILLGVRRWSNQLRISVLIILAGISFHVLLLHFFGGSYFNALSQNFLLIVTTAGSLLTSIKWFYFWCFKYTGWFLMPLAGCLWFTTYCFLRFLFADLRKKPLSFKKVRCLHGRVNYVGITLAGQIGILGTVVYVIIGLGLLAQAMTTLSCGFANGGSGGLHDLLPEVLNTMSLAALAIVPALGTTLVGLVTEAMTNHINYLSANSALYP
ncbi:MAG: hypothetical protein U9R02_06925 [Thermodesulfobacteriota bacterium]|nr:hypothetical protein [Thermodesulfobacteriota bacterium]